MNKIIPSTKFRVLTVHKSMDTVCWARFFWNRVLNLEPAKIHFPFWHGGVLGAGAESVLSGQSLRRAHKAMADESKRRTKRFRLIPADIEEIKLQFEIIKATIDELPNQHRVSFDVNNMRIDKTQLKITFPLKSVDCKFCSMLDGVGTYKGKPALYEFKTAKTIDNNYFTTLAFDPQVCSYVLGYNKSRKNGITRCCYIIFRKMQKRIKKNQNLSQFLKEAQAEFKRGYASTRRKDGKNWYYVLYNFRVGEIALQEAEKDIEAAGKMIADRYNSMSRRELLNPDNWRPRQIKQCLQFGACPYLMLCKNPKKWQTFLPMFRQREMLYEEEREELQK
jgi:hypothetical protein